MKDNNTLVIFLITWLIIFSIGMLVADKYNIAVGLLLCVSVTITAAAILYCDWKNEQTKKRLDRYIEDAKRRYKEVEDDGTGENI